MIGVIILAILVVMLISFIAWLRRKNNKIGTKTVATITLTTGSKNKNWKKKRTYVWLFLLQFFVLDFICPGGRFESKFLFWFIATKNSDKYVAIKKINDILERDEKKKISSLQMEIEEMEGKSSLTPDDKIKLGELASKVLNVGKPTPPSRNTIIHSVEKTEWIMSFTASDKIMKRESAQSAYWENKVLDITSTPTNLRVSYARANGQKKELALTRSKEGSFFSGWVENTHQERKRDNIKIFLLEDKTPPHDITGGVSGKKSKISPQFTGYMGESEVMVKIFKRVSSG